MAKYGVSCEPDTTVHQRSSKDEYVIVASDGVWGALSNNEAALIINSALSKLKEKGISRKKSFAVAAKCLVKAAMNRGSADNISAIIIDVKKAPFTQSLPAAVPTEAIQMQASTLPSMTITTSRGHGSKQNIDPILHSLRPIITTKGAGFQPVNHTSITRTRSTDPRLPFSSLHVSSISLPMLFTPLRSALSESLPIDLIV